MEVWRYGGIMVIKTSAPFMHWNVKNGKHACPAVQSGSNPP